VIKVRWGETRYSTSVFSVHEWINRSSAKNCVKSRVKC